MKQSILLYYRSSRLSVMFGTGAGSCAKIKVVTTLTDLADFAREVGGDMVEVHSLATGVEDTHGVPMKPSFVPIMNRADLLVLVGFDCEHAFLPALLEASKNPRIQIGSPGYVDSSRASSPKMYPNRPITTRATFIPTATHTTCSTRCWQRRRSGTFTTHW